MTSRTNASEIGSALQQVIANPMPYLKMGAVIVAVALFWADMQDVKRDVADIKAILRTRDSIEIVSQSSPLTMLKHAP